MVQLRSIKLTHPLMVQLRSIKLAHPFDGAAKSKLAHPFDGAAKSKLAHPFDGAAKSNKLACPFDGAAIYGMTSLHVLLMVQLKQTSVGILLLHVFSMALTIPYSQVHSTGQHPYSSRRNRLSFLYPLGVHKLTIWLPQLP